MDVSVIVPVYNMESCLERCLGSLFSQQFTGTFEVIAVDDGSTDGSKRLLRKYAERESRLRVIEHDRNKKLSIARSTGMTESAGEYIMHVDADDRLMPGALEGLVAVCRETGADVVVFNYIRERRNGDPVPAGGIRRRGITTDKVKLQRHFYGTCVNKIVRRSLVDNMAYSAAGVNVGEDLLYATEILLRARTVCLTPEQWYVYADNAGSITHVMKPQARLFNTILLLERIEAIGAANGMLPEIRRNALRYIEKLMYEAAAIKAFVDEAPVADDESLLRRLSQFEHLPRRIIRNLTIAFDYKYYCMGQVVCRSGIRYALGIMRLYLKKRVSHVLLKAARP